ncbi:uncharacterized protein LOC101891662 [Musca domestica]|uniref:Uncharacterized protein LOC101891662 n=1 Tax=Musca domestica TaxID=7370 RepID=A0A1I8NCE3_MUSDO|nr:uncharacterized protein LOC101891662 [Musca domestica]
MNTLSLVFLIANWIGRNVLVSGQFNYCIEFLEPMVFAKCDDQPDHFLYKAVDISDLSFQHSREGDLIVKGPIKFITTLPENLPVTIETYKKERGEWQPTLFTLKREDVCISLFDERELWSTYWENTPKEQKTCPFSKGQILDMDFSEQISLNIPMPNVDGEYKSRIELGHQGDEFYMCAVAFIFMHRL